MTKRYCKPNLKFILLDDTEHLLSRSSIKVGDTDEKVDDSGNIGFVKEASNPRFDVWDQQWGQAEEEQ